MKQSFTPQNPDYESVAQDIFQQARFMTFLGAELLGCGPGWCESVLVLQAHHLQQHDFVHGGVIATLADHTAGASAATLIPVGKAVLTVEYKINLLRPGRGEKLRCRADVLKAGKTISVSESEVFAVDGNDERLVAKSAVTLAIV